MIRLLLLLFSVSLIAQDTNYEQKYSSQTTPIDYAIRDIGSKESKGDIESNDILSYFSICELLGGVENSNLFSKDETPWCAAAVTYWFWKAGRTDILNKLSGYDYVRARAFIKLKDYFPSTTIPSQLEYGDLVIFSRGSGGHIGFFEAYDINTNRIRVLGGNQSNTVSETLYLPANKLLIGIKY